MNMINLRFWKEFWVFQCLEIADWVTAIYDGYPVSIWNEVLKRQWDQSVTKSKFNWLSMIKIKIRWERARDGYITCRSACWYAHVDDAGSAWVNMDMFVWKSNKLIEDINSTHILLVSYEETISKMLH